LRWDKPPREADRLETLERMLEKIETGRTTATNARRELVVPAEPSTAAHSAGLERESRDP
jgi:hypothetical protein